MQFDWDANEIVSQPLLAQYSSMSPPLKFERNPRYVLNPASETSPVVKVSLKLFC